MLVREQSGSLGTLNAATTAFSTEDADRIAVVISGTWAGTVQLQTSLDGVSWFPQTATQSTATATTSAANNFNGNGFWHLLTPAKYFRAQMTAYTSGTATITLAAFRVVK